MGLARWAAVLDRDLQRAARRAGGPRALWGAGAAGLGEVLRLEPARVAELVNVRRSFDAMSVRRGLSRAGIEVVDSDEPDFPASLAETPDPPFALFLRGDRARALGALAERPAVAIVGCRHPTASGLAFARTLAHDLARRGAVVVSGLALGIDAAAHQGAHDGGGTTVAVLGSGVDVVYPRRNRALGARLLAAGGLLASEYWPGTTPAPWRFPARNRIVSGLSDAVVVVEAGRRSGALITADFALEMGRPVLAVPGSPGAACSMGCNELIRAGAALCEGADDVAAELPSGGWDPASGTEVQPPTGLAGRVYERLQRQPLRPDQLADDLGASPGEIAGAVALLEVDGLALRGEGQRYWAAPLRGAA
jgi:DNA processing protein